MAELYAAHDQLQNLSPRLLEVQEMERHHIARELHDEIGQFLAALQLLLDMTARSPADVMATNLHKVQALVQELTTAEISALEVPRQVQRHAPATRVVMLSV